MRTAEERAVVAGHRLFGQAIAPAALLVRDALDELTPDAHRGSLCDVLIARPLELEAGAPKVTRIVRPADGSFEVQSRLAGGDGASEAILSRQRALHVAGHHHQLGGPDGDVRAVCPG